MRKRLASPSRGSVRSGAYGSTLRLIYCQVECNGRRHLRERSVTIAVAIVLKFEPSVYHVLGCICAMYGLTLGRPSRRSGVHPQLVTTGVTYPRLALVQMVILRNAFPSSHLFYSFDLTLLLALSWIGSTLSSLVRLIGPLPELRGGPLTHSRLPAFRSSQPLLRARFHCVGSGLQ